MTLNGLTREFKLLSAPGFTNGYLGEGEISGKWPPANVVLNFGCEAGKVVFTNFFDVCAIDQPIFFLKTKEHSKPRPILISPSGKMPLGNATDPDNNPKTDDGPGQSFFRKPQVLPESDALTSNNLF
ncbi:MAG: hypothetical protein CM15mP49_35290 [Actinomycetota bacterium]|nr:MAG: hypothetical protein CM15mP49_35290 [Actinomycetota bacterium]